MKKSFLPVLLITIAITGCMLPEVADNFYTSDDYTVVKKIDAHVHIQTDDTAAIEQATSDNFQLFTINYDDVNEPPPMEVQRDFAVNLIKKFPDHIAFSTGISIRHFNSDDWMNETLAYIKNSVSMGAKAVKIYKVIGMSLRDAKGKIVMVDDPAFDSLFNYLENNNIPVVGHLGEPRNCWLPLDKMTVRGDVSYFISQPEYHMYLHPEMPSYENQIAARDNLLAKHPKLKFVGAHLGSLEYNVDSLAARLDRFPNMSVDMAARIVHLQLQTRDNREKVRNFIIKYSDRLLYATDIVIEEKIKSAEAKKWLHESWSNEWKFFTSNDTMTSSQFDGSFSGLQLPKDVVDNIYYNNARKWLNIF